MLRASILVTHWKIGNIILHWLSECTTGKSTIHMFLVPSAIESNMFSLAQLNTLREYILSLHYLR